MNTYAKLAMICLILFLTTSQALAKVPGFQRATNKALREAKVDMTRPKKNERAFARKFGVEGLPTVAFINSKGTELKELKLVGFTPASKFLKLLKKVK